MKKYIIKSKDSESYYNFEDKKFHIKPTFYESYNDVWLIKALFSTMYYTRTEILVREVEEN